MSMPMTKDPKKEIDKKVKIIVNIFTKEINTSCKIKVETRFASAACRALA